MPVAALQLSTGCFGSMSVLTARQQILCTTTAKPPGLVCNMSLGVQLCRSARLILQAVSYVVAGITRSAMARHAAQQYISALRLAGSEAHVSTAAVSCSPNSYLPNITEPVWCLCSKHGQRVSDPCLQVDKVVACVVMPHSRSTIY